MTYARIFVAMVLVITGVTGIAAQSQARRNDGPVVARVSAPRPWFAPWFLVTGRMQDSIGEYQAIPGLIYKDYTLSDAEDSFGGIYYYESRWRADARYTADFVERGRRKYGSAYRVDLFPALALLEVAPALAVARGNMFAAIATVPSDVAENRADVIREFAADASALRAVAGLRRIYLVQIDDFHFGYIYLWQDAESARTGYATAWTAAMRARFGNPPDVDEFAAPISLNNQAR